MTPKNRSKKWLEGCGYAVADGESRIPHTFITRDLFGFGDLLYAGAGEIGLVQVTTNSNLAARIKKARACPAFSVWLAAGGIVRFHGWAKRGPRGVRKKWEVVERIFQSTESVNDGSDSITENPA